jgi:hypothetical protein
MALHTYRVKWERIVALVTRFSTVTFFVELGYKDDLEYFSPAIPQYMSWEISVSIVIGLQAA